MPGPSSETENDGREASSQPMSHRAPLRRPGRAGARSSPGSTAPVGSAAWSAVQADGVVGSRHSYRHTAVGLRDLGHLAARASRRSSGAGSAPRAADVEHGGHEVVQAVDFAEHQRQQAADPRRRAPAPRAPSPPSRRWSRAGCGSRAPARPPVARAPRAARPARPCPAACSARSGPGRARASQVVALGVAGAESS